MALFFALGRFLGAVGASCCVCCRFWLVFLRLGALPARFSSATVTPKAVLDAPWPWFSKFSRARGHALRDMLYVRKTPLKLMRNAYRPSNAQRKKLAKFASRPGRTELSAKITLKTINNLRARRAWFWRALGTSGATPGRHLAGFWPLLGGTCSLSGASWATLRHSWVSLG